jgi:hypothetical protein
LIFSTDTERGPAARLAAVAGPLIRPGTVALAPVARDRGPYLRGRAVISMGTGDDDG